MALIAFTANYHDRSNSSGYQFEFVCDKCGSGFLSTFQPSKAGIAGGFLRAAGGLFGGRLSQIAAASDQLKDALRGPAWDAAFRTAVEEGKRKFKQCSRCGKWVCPEHCWNAPRAMCETCAPDLQEEAAAAQAMAAKDQIWEKAKQTDQTGGLSVDRVQGASCPHCGAKSTGAKFCAECGKPMQAVKTACGKCGAKIEAGAKFCGECGERLGP
jgi:hypothetical protein